MQHPASHIFEFTPETLAGWCEARGMTPFRAKQILEWIYVKGVADPAQMSNLSKRDREALTAEMTFLSGDPLAHQSATDGTQKLLIEWRDFTESGPSADQGVSLPVMNSAKPTSDGSDRQTECVMIPTEERKTACISSQIGCPVGCRFCASGMGGLDGNLSTGRIVEQVWRLGRLKDVGRISNVVFMGMGEPLSNFKNVTGAIRVITALWGLGISARKVTVSTVGLPQAIRRLAEEFELPVTLALSLHAPNDYIRRKLIPWAEYTTISDLLGACHLWFEKTGREITLEYTLLRDVNDRPKHAEELAGIAKSIRANINLIRYNEVAGTDFQRPRNTDVLEFQKILRSHNINAHIRASRGRDIAAACGQLRHEAAGATGE
ncbi:MAG: 23S rRNA (adenine(2503)-C(2))-methyltransferase RlmN [Phycisphaeraceae bacterium]|nr:23S rRNA (adenine(2503)-C(2))-methyltransferase RlmN [Phycisphaeraceae bacterium]